MTSMITMCRFVLFIMIVSPSYSSANTACESEANPAIRAIVGYSKRLLSERRLTPLELKSMIEGDGLTNPYLSKGDRLNNSFLSKGMDQAIRAVGQNIPAAKVALEKLFSEYIEQESQVEEARENTRINLALANVTTLLENDPAAQLFTRALEWHRNSLGKLELVVLDPMTSKLNIYSPYDSNPVATRDLGIRFSPEIQRASTILTTKNNQLYVAVLGRKGTSNFIVVHDYSKNRTLALENAHHISSFSLIDSPSGDVHLIIRKGLRLMIYQVGSSLNLIEHIELTEEIHEIEVLQRPGNHDPILKLSYGNSIELREIPSGKIIRQFSSREFIGRSSMITNNSGEYILQMLLTKGRKERFAFLTSRSDIPSYSEYFSGRAGPSEWITTQNGRALFASTVIGDNSTTLNIFEPFAQDLTSEVTRRSFSNFLRKETIHAQKPRVTLSFSAFVPTRLRWLETKEDIAIGFSAGHDSRFRLYSFTQEKMIYADFIDGLNSDFLLTQADGRLYLIVDRGIFNPIKIVDLLTNSEVKHELSDGGHILSPLARGNYNDDLLVVGRRIRLSSSPIDVVRIRQSEGR